MNKLKVEDIAAMIKANDFLKKEEEEKKFPRAILWALAIIGDRKSTRLNSSH